MKHIFLIILFTAYQACFSQEIPVGKYDTSIQYSTFKENLNEDERKKLIGISYNKTSYLNAFNGEAIEKTDLKYQFGVATYFRYMVGKQFFIDFEAFYNIYEIKEATLSNYGGEVSAGMILIPFSLKLTSIFQPYAAIGYQGSLMRLENSTSETLKKELDGKTTDTSAPIWKAGMMINLSKTFFINAQYKQSFLSKFDRNFNGWSAGIGFRLK